MAKQTSYVSKKPDENGIVQYSHQENAVWSTLFQRQHKIMPKYACNEYIHGHSILDLPTDRNPQLSEVSKSLASATGWEVAMVPALIPYQRFFNLLANKKFPAATFIRRQDEMDYLEEPDIFHEVYGHCPLLTDQVYANFMQAYGRIGEKATPEDQAMLARIYWYTVEFGLINTSEGLRAYGAGILSSMGETPYALDSDIPQRKPFDVIEVLRTPYRIDIFQTVYFVIDNYHTLYNLVNEDLIGAINKARELGEFEPTFPQKIT